LRPIYRDYHYLLSYGVCGFNISIAIRFYLRFFLIISLLAFVTLAVILTLPASTFVSSDCHHCMQVYVVRVEIEIPLRCSNFGRGAKTSRHTLNMILSLRSRNLAHMQTRRGTRNNELDETPSPPREGGERYPTPSPLSPLWSSILTKLPPQNGCMR
jgi:hypothetical protein